MSLKKFVVYTCITGGYDILHEVKFVSQDIDYICFTDNANLHSNTWQIRQLPEDLSEIKSLVKKQRLIKILPHKYLSEYDVSLWVDSNIEIIGDIRDFFSKYDLSNKFLYVNRHPSRDCIYREQLAIIRLGRDTFENTNEQINRYRDEGFPEHYGLAETNILLRKHSDKRCIRLMKAWAAEIKNGSHRDQLSFNYCLWKCDLKDCVEYLNEKYYNLHFSDNAFFILKQHMKDSNYKQIVVVKDPSKQITIDTNEDDKKEIVPSIASTSTAQNLIPYIKKVEKTAEVSNELPVVPVVIFTHNRTAVAIETIKSLFKNLKYQKLNWIVVDDRSEPEHLLAIKNIFDENSVKYELCQTSSQRFGLGAAMNIGLKKCFEKSEIALRVEDDWILERELDLRKHVETLIKNKNVYAVRLAMVGGNVNYDSRLFKDRDYKAIVGGDSSAWLFVNQVALVHKRAYDALGWYLENVSADRSESEFKERFNKASTNGRSNLVLVPASMKWRTFDDPSLWFIHVGRSTLGHVVYREPKRYSWIYSSEKKKPVEKKKESAKRIDAESLKRPIAASKAEPKSEEKKTLLTKKELEWPTISVMMTTHNRSNVACAVIDSLCKNLKYSGKIHWIISDDRSISYHVSRLKKQFSLNAIADKDVSVCKTDDKRFGLGASLNNGLKEAFRFGSIVMTTEDDWILHRELNLDSYVKLLETEEDVCTIRLAALRGGNPIPSRWKDFYRVICKESLGNADYVFNNQVALRHKKIYDKLGWYKEDKDNNKPEYYMSWKYNRTIQPNKNNNYQVLFPKCCAIRTIDDPTLFFIHCGQSTLNSAEVVPPRFMYLYKSNPKEMEMFDIIEERRKISIKNLYLIMGQLNSQTNEPLDSFTFFEYLQSKEVPSKYVIWKKHYFYEKLKKEGKLKDIIALDGNGCDDFEFLYKCKEELVKCKVVVQENLAMNPTIKKWILGLKDCKHVFLQHGISFLKPQIGSVVNMLKYINVASEKEKKFIQSVAVKNMEDSRFIFGGLPRFDKLEDTSKEQEQKIVFLMPTWRNTFIDSPSSIEKSEYFNNLNSLLSSTLFLEQLKEKNVKIAFSIHHHLRQRIKDIDSLVKNKSLEFVDSSKVQEYIKKSSLCITDYSSVVFDFLFLRKPAIFWNIDTIKDKFLTNKRDINEIKVSTAQKKKLFNVVSSVEDLKQLVLKYADNKFVLEKEKADIADSFFLYKKNVCEELYKGIEKA